MDDELKQKVYEQKYKLEAELKAEGWLPVGPNTPAALNWLDDQEEDMKHVLEIKTVDVDENNIFVGNWILFENKDDAAFFKLTWG